MEMFLIITFIYIQIYMNMLYVVYIQNPWLICGVAILQLLLVSTDLEHLQTRYSIFHLSVTGPGARLNDQVERMTPGNVSVFPYTSTK